MSSRWILRSFATAAVLVALPVMAMAQTSRVQGMALQGDYIKDYTGIYTYVSGVSNVGNLVYGEMGNFLTNSNSPDITGDGFGDYPLTLDRSVGAVLGNLWDGRYGTWAIHLRQETPAIGQGDAFSQPGVGSGIDPNHNTNESFDVMWGKKMGTTNVGLRLNRSYFRFKDEIPGVTTSLEFDAPSTPAGGDPNLARNVLGLGGGIGFEMNPNTSVELSILYQSRTFESGTTGGTKNEEDSPTTYSIAGRAWWQWQPNVMVVPVFKYYSFDLSNKITPPAPGAATTFNNSLRGWQAGIAGNWTIGSNDLFVLGATFAQNKLEQEYDILGVGAALSPGLATPLGPELKVTETIYPQVFAALETHVNNWLTLRFGANKGAWQTLKVDDLTAGADQEVNVDYSPFSMSLGAGVKLGTLQLDAVLNDQFPQTLGGFFSQIPNFVSFPKVTATYAF